MTLLGRQTREWRRTCCGECSPAVRALLIESLVSVRHGDHGRAHAPQTKSVGSATTHATVSIALATSNGVLAMQNHQHSTPSRLNSPQFATTHKRTRKERWDEPCLPPLFPTRLISWPSPARGRQQPE